MAMTAKKEWLGACCLAAGVAVYAFFAAQSGASLLFLSAAAAACLLCIWLPGRSLARFAFPGLWAQGAAASLTAVLGLSVFALCTVLASLTGVRFLTWLPLAALLLPSRAQSAPRRSWLPFCLTAAVVLLLLAPACGRFAHPAAVGITIPQQDFYWNVGNAESFALGFPPSDLRYSGYTLTYHYLTELLEAGLSFCCGISCYDAAGFAAPPLVLLAAAAIWQELGRLFWPGSRLRAPLLPAAVLLLGSVGGTAALAGRDPFWNLLTIHLLTNINAVATAALLLGAFLVLFARLSAGGYAVRRAVPCVLAFLLLCLGKGPVAALVALAALCAVVLSLPRGSRSEKLRSLGFALLLCLLFLLCFRLLFAAGADSSVEFSLHATLEKGAFAPLLTALKARNGLLYTVSLPLWMIVQCVCMAPFAFPLFCGAALHTLRHLKQADPARLFCFALGFGGLLAFFLFDHPAMSQCYFAYAALGVVDLIALDALPSCRGLLRVPAAALGALSVLTGVLACVFLMREGCTALWNPSAAVQAHPQYTPLTADEEEAMQWLRTAMPEDAYFATNRMHTGAAEEGLSNVYSGLSGRRAYMESFQYAKTNLGVPAEEFGARYDRMAALFGMDGVCDPARAEQICRDTRVGWLVCNTTLPGSDAAFETGSFCCVYENDTVKIYRFES